MYINNSQEFAKLPQGGKSCKDTLIFHEGWLLCVCVLNSPSTITILAEDPLTHTHNTITDIHKHRAALTKFTTLCVFVCIYFIYIYILFMQIVLAHLFLNVEIWQILLSLDSYLTGCFLCNWCNTFFLKNLNFLNRIASCKNIAVIFLLWCYKNYNWYLETFK